MSNKRIYLDNNATTPLDPEVLERMTEALAHLYGNPSSIHIEGQEARAALAKARADVAQILGAKPREIIFTSTATEGLDLLIRGLVPNNPCHILSSALEHPAVLKPLDALSAYGHRVQLLEPGEYGAARPEQVAEACNSGTKLIVLMAANNETGVLADIPAIAEIAHGRGIPLIVDLVASFGKVPAYSHPGITAFAISAHKIHGPKGTAALFLKSQTKFCPQVPGGGQESGRRGGTENVAAIVGFAKAVQKQLGGLEENMRRMQSLRDHFEKELFSHVADMEVNGAGPRVCNVSNLYFPGVEGESLLMNLDLAGVAASHGSACSSGALEPSRVLLAMGYCLARAASSLRFSLSRFTTLEEIDYALEVLIPLIKRQRYFTPRQKK